MQIQTEYGDAFVLLDCPLLASTERLDFLTEVHAAFDGSEHREALREQPRITLEYKYTDNMDMFNILYANMRGLFAIPQFYLKQKITVQNTSNVMIENADEFYNYVLIENQVYKVDSSTDDSIVLSEEINVTDVYIMPLRLCIIDGDVDMNSLGYYAEQNITFRVIAEDLPTIRGAGDDIVLNDEFLSAGLTSLTLSQDQTIVDGDVGGFQSFTKWKHPRYSKPYIFVLDSFSEFIAHRRLLMYRMGRLGAFWMPLYERHLDVLSVGTDWIQVSSDVVSRKHLAIKTASGWGQYEIILNTAGKLYLDRQLDGVIEKVYYSGLYRFDNDSITYDFLGNNVTKTTILILELEP